MKKKEKKFKKSDSFVITRSKAAKQSREGTCMHWIATSLRSSQLTPPCHCPLCHCRAWPDNLCRNRLPHQVRQWVARIRVLTEFCSAKLAIYRLLRRFAPRSNKSYALRTCRDAWNVNRKMNKTPKARAVVFEAAPEIEHRRRRSPRERRLKAGKMLWRSILSESPSSCAAKACGAWDCDRKGSAKPR